MSKFSVDYSALDGNINKKIYRLNEVKDRIEKVAFDIVRFKDEDVGAKLWQVQSADDGDYIIALYEEPSEEIKTANNWNVLINKISGDMQILYKNDALVRIASSKLGIVKEELESVKRYLPKKLAENKRLVNSLLNELDSVTKTEVLAKYPELV